MKVHWVFDEEEWDPFTLLGEIRITGDHESEIRDDCIILDTWFLALIEGLESLSRGRSKDVDLVDESDPLRFATAGHRYEIRYKDQTLSFGDVSLAYSHLREVVCNFVDILRGYPEPRDETIIGKLSRLVGNRHI